MDDSSTTETFTRSLLGAGGFNDLALAKHGYLLYNRNDIYIGRAIQRYGEYGELEAGLFKSCGRPALNVEVKIVNADGGEVSRGAVGELWSRGPNVMLGYWNQPELTAAALHDGWMRSGDAAYMDEDGYVYIVDRVKDMIITGGENVYSAEVESAVHLHAAVTECAVIGLPDDTWGERVHAIVRLTETAGERRGDHPALPRPYRRLQVPAQRRFPHRTPAALRRRQDSQDRAAKALLGGPEQTGALSGGRNAVGRPSESYGDSILISGGVPASPRENSNLVSCPPNL